jgi:hypothetical protein
MNNVDRLIKNMESDVNLIIEKLERLKKFDGLSNTIEAVGSINGLAIALEVSSYQIWNAANLLERNKDE